MLTLLAHPSSCLQGAVAEGVLTSRSAHHLAQRQGIECPVISGIYRVIHEGADPVGGIVCVCVVVVGCSGVEWGGVGVRVEDGRRCGALPPATPAPTTATHTLWRWSLRT